MRLGRAIRFFAPALFGVLSLLGLAARNPGIAQIVTLPEGQSFGALAVAKTREELGAEADIRAIQSRVSGNSKILNGRVVRAGTYPWIVAIGYFSGRAFVQSCGGTVIRPGWILTAAHCPMRLGDAVIVRKVDLSLADKPDAQIQAIRRGPYRTEDNDSDYALVRLDHDPGIPPIAVNQDVDLETRRGTELIIVGWGRPALDQKGSDVLLEGAVRTVDYKECIQDYQRVPLSVTPTMFCANAKKVDACYGDSGGPALFAVKKSKDFLLMGIVSWGKDCGHYVYPGVYTRASVVDGWIDQEIARYTAGEHAPTT